MTDLALDITTTATLRPEILDHTYTVFRQNLFIPGPSYRVILNVDPVGDESHKPGDVIRIAAKHFEDIAAQSTQHPSFPRAVRWCWNMVETEYFFNLEDDWDLFEKADLTEMVGIMDEHKDLALLRLPFFPARADTCRQWNRHIPWNGQFFEVPKDKICTLGYSGHPSLIRRDFIRQVLPWLQDKWCPEKILKGWIRPVKRILDQWRFGVFQKPMQRPIIRDIGRKWREKRRLYKHRGYTFQTWEVMEEGYNEKTWFQKKRKETP